MRSLVCQRIGSVWGIRTPASLVESRSDLPIVEHAALLYESEIHIFSALPLSYRPMVGRTGFEPATSTFQGFVSISC